MNQAETHQYRCTTQTHPRGVELFDVKENNIAALNRLRRYIQSFCGIYTRVARRLGVDRTYVSRVAKGERHSLEIEKALIQEFEQAENEAG